MIDWPSFWTGFAAAHFNAIMLGTIFALLVIKRELDDDYL